MAARTTTVKFITMKYLIILEPTDAGYSAYSPDLDGCVAAGDDRDETIALMREAIKFHLEGMAPRACTPRRTLRPEPLSRSEAATVDV